MNSGNANGSDGCAPYQWRAVAEHWGATLLVLACVLLGQGFVFFRNLAGPVWIALVGLAFGLEFLGAGRIAVAKIPVYRARRFATLGLKAAPANLRALYRLGWGLFLTGAALAGCLLLANDG